jgi:hypothetical protein
MLIELSNGDAEHNQRLPKIENSKKDKLIDKNSLEQSLIFGRHSWFFVGSNLVVRNSSYKTLHPIFPHRDKTIYVIFHT